ncbi:MAG TPA: hypothetical protein VFZ59_03450 [Verrucomicrobiae bacterium]|nr:hypothetical protein [Verrucomicrobiae bacterium]
MRSLNFTIYGQPEPPPKLVPLQAGPLTLLYDPGSGMVRRIKLGEREVLRGIYAAVRDRDWGTVPGVIQETKREIGTNSFLIEFTSAHRQAEINFMWHGRIRGSALGEIRYEFDGAAHSDFLRNRIGFCVLHPISECAGARARQTRIDGRTVDCRFPDLIEPQIFGQSSFRQLRAVAHEVSPELWAEVSFSGDTFEMEDQRNWTDASFKTYCTPLSLPFPVPVKTGDHIQQTVELRLQGTIPSTPAVEISSPRTSELSLTIPDVPRAQLPDLGLGVASHGEPLSETELARLQRLKLSHLRADVRLGCQHQAQLAQWFNEAAQLQSKLEIALILPAGNVEAEDTVKLLHQNAAGLVRVLALREGEAATSSATLLWVRTRMDPCGVPIGAGSDCNFCELNREQTLGRLGSDKVDFLFWSMNPQVHAFDHMSILETLEAQAATAQSARAFARGRDLVVSPATLKQRFNPVATSTESTSTSGDLPPQVDARQLSRFAAAWTLGSIAAFTEAGLRSVTYYETTGWRGVMEQTSGSPLPDKFPSAPGEIFPVFDVFEKLAGFRQCAVTRSSRSEDVIALSLFSLGKLKRTLFANLTGEVVQLRANCPTESKTLALEPFATTELDHDKQMNFTNRYSISISAEV